ncbi:MAG TPA: EAL domain-containing protein, partial [Arenimonas sp.]|nr:EAL domain-containing protein [Arenimonas sp.]
TNLAARAGDTASSAILLPLRDPALSAQAALDRAESELRKLRKAGGGRLQLDAGAASPPPPPAANGRASPLPTERMRLQIKPLHDIDRNPQPLHDASIHLSEVDGLEPPLSSLLSEVVAKGLATQLDLWEMHAAVEHLRALPEGARGVEIAMRLSTASRESAMLVPVVRNALAALPKDRGFRLVFEVQESWLVDHNAIAVEMVEGLRGLGCGVMLGDFGGTDNPRNVAWASWFDYARISNRRHEHLAGRGDARSAAEKLVRTAASRGARIIAGRVPGKALRSQLGEWGVALFE